MASRREICLLTLALPPMCHIVLARSLSFCLSQFLTFSEGQKGIFPTSHTAARFTLRTGAKCFEILGLNRADCDETRMGKGIIYSSLWKSGRASQALGFAVDGLDVSQRSFENSWG